MQQPRRSLVLREIRECDFFLLGSLRHSCPQFLHHHHHKALTSQHLSSPQAYLLWIPATSSLASPGSCPVQSWPRSKAYPLSKGGVTELSGSEKVVAETSRAVLRVDNSLLGPSLLGNIYILMETILNHCVFSTWFSQAVAIT